MAEKTPFFGVVRSFGWFDVPEPPDRQRMARVVPFSMDLYWKIRFEPIPVRRLPIAGQEDKRHLGTVRLRRSATVRVVREKLESQAALLPGTDAELCALFSSETVHYFLDPMVAPGSETAPVVDAEIDARGCCASISKGGDGDPRNTFLYPWVMSLDTVLKAGDLVVVAIIGP